MQPHKYFKKNFSHHYLEIKSKGPSHSSSGDFGPLLPFLSKRETCPVFVKRDVILRNRKASLTYLEFGHFFLPLPSGERPSSGKAKLGKGKKATVRSQLPGWLVHVGLNVIRKRVPFSRQSQWRHNPVRRELDSSSPGPPWPAAWVHEQPGNSPTLCFL